jgi:hypothetical protein
MAQPKNTLARVLIPLVAILIGIGFAVSVFLNSGKQTHPTPVTVGSPTGATGASGAAAPSGVPASTGVTGSTGATGPTGVPAPLAAQPPAGGGISLDGLRALPVEGDGTKGFASIGSLDENQPLPGKLEFSTLGAGITSRCMCRPRGRSRRS